MRRFECKSRVETGGKKVVLRRCFPRHNRSYQGDEERFAERGFGGGYPAYDGKRCGGYTRKTAGSPRGGSLDGRNVLINPGNKKQSAFV